MENKIGDIVTIDGRQMEVVEGCCNDCSFFLQPRFFCFCMRDEGIIGHCVKENRTDNKDIIYKEIK